MTGLPPRLSEELDNLKGWERDRVLADVRGAYGYAQSAAQRAVARITEGEHHNSDALFESIWWIAACDGYLHTTFGRRWRQYKDAQPWADLVNGILWARNQSSHDPLAIVPLFDRWQVVDGVMRRRSEWLWAPHDQIPIADRENEAFARAYRTAVEGRPMIDAVAEAVEAMRHVIVDDVASFGRAST